MAGIDKTCEYSGEYAGAEMYRYKHNSIQVLPKHLSNFKDKYAVLIFFSDPSLTYCLDDAPSPFVYFRNMHKFMPKFWTRYYWYWRKYGKFYDTPVLEWKYCLYVPSCAGKVDGKYYNYTKSPIKTVKNLKR